MTDTNDYFDIIGEYFVNTIYTSLKGEVRCAVLMRDLSEVLQKRRRILDLGAGSGQIALLCAKMGHHVTLVDCAASLLQHAESTAHRYGVTENIRIIQADIFKLDALLADMQFDGVFCHAVAEWVPDVDALLDVCRARVRLGGFLSLMFYNRLALEFIHHVFGNFSYIDSNFSARSRAKLTPNFARLPETMATLLDVRGFKRMRRSGVRCFYDYMKEKDRTRHSPKVIIARELMLSDREEFLSVARYVHELRVG